MHLTQFEVSYDDVMKGLLSVDTWKSSEPKKIPNIVLKKCAIGICDPVTHLFSTSLKRETFPDRWTTSYI